MVKRESPTPAPPTEEQLHELDVAVAEVLGSLDAALADSSAQGGSGAIGAARPAAESRARQAIARLVAITRNRPGPGDVDGSSGVDHAVLLARARSSLQAFAREAKAERQRAAYETANAAEWERNAKLAVRAGDDDLARQALGRRAECVRLATFHGRRADLLDAQFSVLMSALEGDPKPS